MKRILSITIWALIFSRVASKAQIFAPRSTNESVTVTPQGISSKMASATLPSSNIALGEDALKLATTVISNTAVGYKTLSKVTVKPGVSNNGSFNTAVGSLALQNNTTGFSNSALGYSALTGNTAGIENSAFGYLSLTANTEGNSNSAFGSNALKANTTISGVSGSYNSAFGSNAMKANTTGSNNSAMGSDALLSNTTGSYNSAFGYRSLAANLIGKENAAFGAFTLENSTGDGNAAFGLKALKSNTSGYDNVAAGYQAMASNTAGFLNIALGKNALYSNISGNNNIAIGESALYTSTGTNNVAIGYQAGYNAVGNNKLYIDNSNSASPLIGGDFGSNKVGINRNLSTTGATDFVNRTENFQVEGEAFKTLGTGNWIIPSDRRLKKNITTLSSDEMLQKVVQMRGVTYVLKANPEKGIQYGFIAQELREVFPDKVSENKAGYLSASYGDFDPMIVEAIKALTAKLEQLEQENHRLQKLVTQLSATKNTAETQIKVGK